MDRRSFLGIVGASALVTVGASCRSAAGYDDASLTRPELLAALGPERVRAIGTAYRAAHPNENDLASIRHAIVVSRPWQARLMGAVTPSLADLVREDFERGRTVVVDGWLLSATEARQCALFSLRAA